MANIEKTEPAYSAASVTTSDTAPIDPTRALYVGGAGDIKVDMQGGGTVTFAAVPAGSILPIRAVRIYATGTTATTIIALY